MFNLTHLLQHSFNVITSSDFKVLTRPACQLVWLLVQEKCVEDHYDIVDIDECASDPCANGGNCTDQVNKYNCSCVAGYDGNRCQTSKTL